MRKSYLGLPLVVLLAGPVFGNQCPMDMQAIDAALATNPQLSAEDLAKVKELRAKGEELHNSGNHSESVATLGEAKKILGIQ
jgi:hypothetical protein